MSDVAPFPTLPDNMLELTEGEQATIIVWTVATAAELYAILEARRQALIDWINKTPVEQVNGND